MPRMCATEQTTHWDRVVKSQRTPGSSRVQFLHPVGRSTLRQGITVPVSSQLSWLSQIQKGQKMCVKILFGKGRSVHAWLRRINNAAGHLQFRYESREQAQLRTYLRAAFGEDPKGTHSVLEVEEVADHAFLLRPIPKTTGNTTTLSLYRPYHHNVSKAKLRHVTELHELREVLRATSYKDTYSQREYNKNIRELLIAGGWRREVRVAKGIGLRSDFEKNRVWLEIEFGNARTYYQNYIKFLLAMKYQRARCGILLCPTDAFARLLCELGQKRARRKQQAMPNRVPSYSGMMSYEKAVRELPFLRFILTGSIILGGIHIDG